MRIRHGTAWRFAGIGVACLAFLSSHTVQAQVKLEYKFPEGKKFSYKSTVKTKQTLTLQGMAIETESEQVVVTARTAGKRRDDATVPVEEKVESLRVELSLPGGINVTFDSSNPDAKIDNPQLAFLGEALKLSSETVYTLVLDEQKKVKAVEGTEKLLEKAEKLSPQAKDQIHERMQADKIKMRFEQELRVLPDVLARPGESWERTEVLDIGSGQTLTFKKKYEYLGTEKRGDQALDKIGSKVTEVELKMDPASNSPLKIVKAELKAALSEGTLLFDREAGHVVSAKGKTQIKGDMLTFSLNGTEIPGALDLTIESNTELQAAPK
jgi:Family of unknown function (DUF6263)